MNSQSLSFLMTLETLIAERQVAAPEGSYTASLFRAGPMRIAQKVGEEGVELALAGATGENGAVVSEAADLVFHLLVLLRARNIPLADVITELERRHT